MLSKSSLEAELMAYEPDPGYRGSINRQVLKRWIERCSKDNLDKTLSVLLRKKTVPELAGLVLRARHEAQAIADRLYGMKLRGKDVTLGLRDKRHEWQKLWNELRHPSLAAFGIMHRLNDLLLLYSGCLHERPRKRENHAACRNRLFWIYVSEDLMKQSGGRAFDGGVAILTEIAFNLKEHSVDSKHVTEARRRWRAEQH